MIAGAPDPQGLYMRPALDWLLDDGVEDVIATSEINAQWPNVRGRPTDYLPLVGIEDTVYVAGPVGLVDAVKRKARQAAARCYADPFLPSSQAASVTDRVLGLFRGGKRETTLGRRRRARQPAAERRDPQRWTGTLPRRAMISRAFLVSQNSTKVLASGVTVVFE